MKTFNEIQALAEGAPSFPEPRSGDEANWVDKHVVQVTDHPQNQDKAHKPKTSKDKSKRASYHDGEDAEIYEESEEESDSEVYERALTDAEKKKKEDVVKALKRSAGDFKSRYGKDAESVMHAVATKQAKEETAEVEEELTYEDLADELDMDVEKVEAVLNALSDENLDMFLDTMEEDREWFEENARDFIEEAYERMEAID